MSSQQPPAGGPRATETSFTAWKRWPSYILAGGRSRRFGSDKAEVLVDCQPLIVKLQNELRSLGHETYVVADRADRYSAWGMSCLVDAAPNCGPLAGLATALQHCQTRLGNAWLLLVACDLVCWQDAWYQELVQATAGSQPGEDPQAVVFRQERVQPVPGLYHASAYSLAAQRLASGHLALHGLLEQLNTSTLVAARNPCHYSFNTRAEFEVARNRGAQDVSDPRPRGGHDPRA